MRSFVLRKDLLLLPFLFLLFFPKGGVKLGPYPITFGYLILFFLALATLAQKPFSVQIDRLKVLACMLPFQLLSFISFMSFSVLRTSQLVSFVLSLYFLPLLFFFLFSKPLEEFPEKEFIRWIKRGVFFVGSYGIFLFFYKICMGHFFCIPLLTVNLGDYKNLAQKCIDRGFGFKLISTYNNGNLYGICLLMLFPIYCIYEKSFVKKSLCKLSFLLTLSRTIWIGYLAFEMLYVLFIQKKKKRFFWILISSSSLLTGFCLFLSYYFTLPLSFFLDVTLGGRAKLIKKAFSAPSFLPYSSFQEIRESVYPSIFEQFGLLGLLSFCLFLFSPALIKCMGKKRLNKKEKGYLLGMILYWILCFSDGGMLLIPTLVFYFFISSLLLKKRFLDPTSSHFTSNCVQ